MWLFANGRHRRGRWKNEPHLQFQQIDILLAFSLELGYELTYYGS